MALPVQRSALAVIAPVAGSALLTAVAAAVLWTAGGEPSLSYNVLILACAAACFCMSYLFMTRTWRRRRKALEAPFPAEHERLLRAHVAYYEALSQDERARFRREVQVFLAEHPVLGVGTDVDERVRVLVAASAVIPLFAIPDREYPDVGEILIYPSDFDDDFNFTRSPDEMMGMVTSDSSAVILAKPALLEAFRGRARMHVGIHEFVHKLDNGEGGIDGAVEALADRATLARWKEISRREIDALERRESDIDDYALSADSEFFPVLAEYFFQDPAAFARLHGELYEVMMKIFRQDPRAILGAYTPHTGTANRRRRPGRL
ncbi:MAG: hypothetical protein EPN93_10375 [Spirochaetes bacterium]|nr:MAG: hypothetical protein EPN93_10375 [Spirochaetota bacterium]